MRQGEGNALPEGTCPQPLMAPQGMWWRGHGGRNVTSPSSRHWASPCTPLSPTIPGGEVKGRLPPPWGCACGLGSETFPLLQH